MWCIEFQSILSKFGTTLRNQINFTYSNSKSQKKIKAKNQIQFYYSVHELECDDSKSVKMQLFWIWATPFCIGHKK